MQFARAGWTSRLALGGTAPQAGGSALATVTDARALPDDGARAATADTVVRLVQAGTDYLYVKVDSTMRGSIRAQIDGALSVWEQQHPGAFAVVCPAYPAMGRTIEASQLRVNGEPVESTAVGRDPVTPVTTSNLLRLLPGSVGIRLEAGTTAEHARQLAEAARSGSGAVVVDGSSDADLGLLGAALAELGPQAVPVGSAGLAGALAAYWSRSADPAHPGMRQVPPAGRILILVSSLHDMSRGQADRFLESAAAEDVLVLRPASENLQDRSTAASWAEHHLRREDLPPVVLVLSTLNRSRASGSLGGAAIADGLATVIGTILHHTDIAALILMGGDGARAVLNATSAQSVVVSGSLQEGVPVGVIDGGSAAGVRVVTKAGGFGHPDSLIDIVNILSTPSLLPTEARP